MAWPAVPSLIVDVKGQYLNLKMNLQIVLISYIKLNYQ